MNEIIPEAFSKQEVLAKLREAVLATSQANAAATLGVTPSFISQVLAGKRKISDDLAWRLGGFVEVRGVFIKMPNKPVKAAKK